MKEAETTTNYFPSSHVISIIVWSLSVSVVPHFFAVIRRKNVGSARSGRGLRSATTLPNEGRESPHEE